MIVSLFGMRYTRLNVHKQGCYYMGLATLKTLTVNKVSSNIYIFFFFVSYSKFEWEHVLIIYYLHRLILKYFDYPSRKSLGDIPLFSTVQFKAEQMHLHFSCSPH